MLTSHFCYCQYVQIYFIVSQTKLSVITEIVVLEFINKSLNFQVILGIRPRITEGKVVLRLITESVLKRQLKAFFAFYHSILLNRVMDSIPVLILLYAVNWEMAFLE